MGPVSCRIPMDILKKYEATDYIAIVSLYLVDNFFGCRYGVSNEELTQYLFF